MASRDDTNGNHLFSLKTGVCMAKKIVSIEDRIPKLKEKRKRKTRIQLVILLVAFFILVTLILYFSSSYSKINEIEVTGNQYLSSTEIVTWSEIQQDDFFITLSKKRTTEQLMEHEEIKDVTIDKKFPNKLVINVEENGMVGYIKQDDTYLPVLESGMIVERSATKTPTALPILYNFQQDQYLEKFTQQLNEMPKEVTDLISEVHYAPSEQDPTQIYMYMSDGNKVNGSITDLAEKMSYYPNIVANISPLGTKGVIDIEVGAYFTPY